MFNAITSWYVNYCDAILAWCAAHPAVTAIGLIVDAIVMVVCCAIAAYIGYKAGEYWIASKTKV